MAGLSPIPPAPSPAPNSETDNDDQLRLREEECSSQSPCDRCQGDCDDDDQCVGVDLVCFQRIDGTADSPVPGCMGDAVAGEYAENESASHMFVFVELTRVVRLFR